MKRCLSIDECLVKEASHHTMEPTEEGDHNLQLYDDDDDEEPSMMDDQELLQYHIDELLRVKPIMKVKSLQDSLKTFDIVRRGDAEENSTIPSQSQLSNQQQEEGEQEQPDSTPVHSTHAIGNERSFACHSVNFHEILIREYDVILADNPACSGGPPIGLGWEFTDVGVMTVDYYERERPPRRRDYQMMVPDEERRMLLMEYWEVSRRDVANMVRECTRVRYQRRRTVNAYQTLDEALERVVRFLRSILLCHSRTYARAVANELVMRSKEASRARETIQRTTSTSNTIADDDDDDVPDVVFDGLEVHIERSAMVQPRLPRPIIYKHHHHYETSSGGDAASAVTLDDFLTSSKARSTRRPYSIR